MKSHTPERYWLLPKAPKPEQVFLRRRRRTSISELTEKPISPTFRHAITQNRTRMSGIGVVGLVRSDSNRRSYPRNRNRKLNCWLWNYSPTLRWCCLPNISPCHHSTPHRCDMHQQKYESLQRVHSLKQDSFAEL